MLSIARTRCLSRRTVSVRRAVNLYDMMGELARCPAARMLIEQDAAVSQAGKRKGAVCRLSLDLARDIRGVFSISGRTPATITAGPWHEHGQLSAVCSRPMRFPICATSAAAFTERYLGKGRTFGADMLAMGRGREAREGACGAKLRETREWRDKGWATCNHW